MGRSPDEKTGLHPRNRHRGRYDFVPLVEALPALGRFVAVNAYGDPSIDFANPDAVLALNGAILKQFYGVSGWSVPPGYLCPPIPGRADYVHHVADLLAEGGAVPRGTSVRILDVGVGANAVFPLIGLAEYGWSFVGADIDPVALEAAATTLRANPGIGDAIRLRRQPSADRVLHGLFVEGETFDATMCNPPFHASLAEAREGTGRKWRQLGKAGSAGPVRNFGGQGAELWCPGGEAAFVGRLVEESVPLATRCRWFSTLVSRKETLPGLERALRKAGVVAQRTIALAQGQKRSRVVAWTFLDPARRKAWKSRAAS